MAHTAGLSVQLVLMLQLTSADVRRFDYEHITGHITSYKLLLIPVKKYPSGCSAFYICAQADCGMFRKMNFFFLVTPGGVRALVAWLIPQQLHEHLKDSSKRNEVKMLFNSDLVWVGTFKVSVFPTPNSTGTLRKNYYYGVHMLYDYLVYIYHVYHLFPTEVIQILPSYSEYFYRRRL